MLSTPLAASMKASFRFQLKITFSERFSVTCATKCSQSFSLHISTSLHLFLPEIILFCNLFNCTGSVLGYQLQGGLAISVQCLVLYLGGMHVISTREKGKRMNEKPRHTSKERRHLKMGLFFRTAI